MGGSFQLRRQQDIVAQMIGYLMGHTPHITDYSSGSIIRSLCESIAEEMYSHNVAFAEGISEAISTSVKQAFNFPLQQPQNATGEVTFYRQMLASPTVLYSNESNGLTSSTNTQILSSSLYMTDNGLSTGKVFGKLVGGATLYYGVSGAKQRSGTQYETASTPSSLVVSSTSSGATITKGRVSVLTWEKSSIYDAYNVYRSSVDPSILSTTIPVPINDFLSNNLDSSLAIETVSGSSGLFGEYFFSVSAKDVADLVSTGSKPFSLTLVNQSARIQSTAIPNANGYRFYRSIVARPIASKINLTATSGGSFAAAQTYHYKIAAIKMLNNTSYLGPVTESKTVSTSLNQSVNISFALVSEASRYRIYRYTTDVPPVKTFLIDLDVNSTGVYSSAFIRPVITTPQPSASSSGLPSGTWTYRVAPIFSSTNFGEIIGISSNSISISNTVKQTFTVGWSWGSSFVKYNTSNQSITPITKVRVYRKCTNALVSSFTGSISGTTLTVTAVSSPSNPPISIGQTLSSTGTETNVSSGTKIISQSSLSSGEVSGGIGRYIIDGLSQAVSSRSMTATVSSSQWAYKDISSATIGTTSFSDSNNIDEWTVDQYSNDTSFPSSPMITYNDTGATSLSEDTSWPYDAYLMQNCYYVDSATNAVFWTDTTSSNTIVWPYVHKINNFLTTVSAQNLISSKSTIIQIDNPTKTLYVSIDTGEVPVTADTYYATWPTTNNAQSVEGALSIPAGTRISVPGTYKIYETLSTTSMESNLLSKEATAVCVSSGIIGNTAIGSVTNLDTNVYGIASVTNLKAFTSGKNLETEQEWRVRFQKNIKQLARGTIDALEEGAKQAFIADANGIVTEQITKSFAYQNTALSTVVYVANQSGYAPSGSILLQVEKILTGYTTADGVKYPGYKPAGIPTTIRAATFAPVDITINATLSTGYKISTLSTAIEKTVESYIMSLDISDGFTVPVLSQSALTAPTILGSYSGSTLTVTQKTGTIYIGQKLTGTNVPANTIVKSIISSPGSSPTTDNPWTYSVSQSLPSGTTVTFPISASTTSLFSDSSGLSLYESDGFAQYQVVLTNVNGQKSIPSNTLQISNVPSMYNYIPIEWTIPSGSSSAILNAEVLRWNVSTGTWKLLSTVIFNGDATKKFIDTNIIAQNDYTFATNTRSVFQKSALVQKLMRIPGIVAVKVYSSYNNVESESIIPDIGDIISLGSLTVR